MCIDQRAEDRRQKAEFCRTTGAASYHPARSADNHQSSVLRPLSSERGFSLIELILFIVIISVAVAGILLVMNQVTNHSADSLIRKQALAIAESLLEEVEMMPFTYCDPDDARAVSAASAVGGCAVAANEQDKGGAALTSPTPAGEVRGSLSNAYDNVADYGGYSMAAGSITNINGSAVGPTAGYSATVAIARAGSAFLGTSAADNGAALQITVTVDGPGSTQVRLDSYRTRYAPK